MCDEIAIINHGDMIVRDTTSALLGRLDAKTLVITPEDEPAALPQIGGVKVTQRPGGKIAFDFNRSDITPGAILEAVRDAGISLRDVATEEPDLEDVFLALTHSD
jgi:ABC-2 type transport system ATP-binding protein